MFQLKKSFLIYPIVFMVLLIAGCASTPTLDNGRVVRESYCNGKKNDWESCYAKAKKSCPKGYRLIRKDPYRHNYAMPTTGALGFLITEVTDSAINGKDGHRRLVFECKK